MRDLTTNQLVERYEINEILSDRIKDKTIPIICDHNKGKMDFISQLRYFELEDCNYKKLKAALQGGPKLVKPIRLTKTTDVLLECHECGQGIGLETDGYSIRCYNPCIYPNGHPAIIYELNIPSGKMVVGNDFRDYFPIHGYYAINLLPNIAKTSHAYAKAGLAHGYVGNTCPGFWQLNSKKTRFCIGNNYSERPIRPHAEEVAGIITGLWWYSVADYDEFIKVAKIGPNDSIVECKPGVYRFTDRYHQIRNDDFTKSQIYTKIEWVRQPDPIVDYRSHYNSLNPTAGQVLLSEIRHWPLLFLKNNDEKGMESFRAAANQVLLASSSDLHPNGWLGGNPDVANDLEDCQVPVFEGEYSWYQLYEDSFIVKYAEQSVRLNDSFIALAFNVLHCISKYGVAKENRHRFLEYDQQTEKLAKLALESLAKKHPDLVPEYCREILK